ncbi:hypothetical protein WOLCODRAFT_136647 [Wolfiporia cocos MD-104 SS10]|uniref:Uncharacterized protein n=1 Tax=Wolfiporia cocos (strain MD-104) TaxID=742152 RepID=A0A2H3JV99_WOLCO|nr:hypothetical protein WOLCODRAFT_136647 [Wolfiporia cocos MD-104 SS10]
MDPADAQDLREFLEAEQRRKEMFGDPDEEEVAMDPVSLRLPQAPKTPDKRATSQPRCKSRSRGRRTSVAPRAGQQARAPRSLPHIDPLGDDPFENYVSSSEDELAVWAVDTSTPARPRKPRPSQVNDIIDVMSSPSPSPPPVRRAKSRGPTQNASREPSPPRARSIPRGRSKTPAQRKTNMSPPPIPKSSKSQLLTPPPSVQSCTPDIVSHSGPVVPHFPSPPPRPKPRPRYKGAVSHAEIGVTEASRALLRPHNAKKATTSTKLLRQATPGPSNAASTSRLVAEVAIPYNPGASTPFKNIQRVSPKRSARRIADDSDTDIAATRVDKGKGKQRSSTTNLGDPGEHELPARHASSASALRLANEPPSPGSARQRRAKSAAPLRSRKRKRVVSLSPSSASGESENDDQDLASYPNYYRSQTRDDQPGPSSRRASYGVPARRARSQPRSADESDGDGHRRHSRAHHALHVPSSDSFSSMHSPMMSYMPRVNERYPPPMTHDPQWHYQIAQMWHHLAYLLHSSPGMSGFQGSKPAYPPPFAMPSPRHRQLHSERRQAVESLYDASTSRLSSFDAAPMSDIPLPPFTSAFSDGTLPPSSPLSGTSGRSSSGPSSPVLRSQSVARGRSKSVGRRVSFMMSGSDRPVIPTSAADLSSDDEVAFLAVPQRARSRSRQVVDRDDRAGGQEKGKGTGLTRSSSLKLTSSMGTPRLSEKAKGKQRAGDEEEVPPSESGGSSDVGRWERGRTPGPPGQRAKSMFGRLGGGR